MNMKYNILIKIFVIFFCLFSNATAGEYDDLIGLNDPSGREIIDIYQYTSSYYDNRGRKVTTYYVAVRTVERNSNGDIISDSRNTMKEDEFDQYADQIRDANQPEEEEVAEEVEEVPEDEAVEEDEQGEEEDQEEYEQEEDRENEDSDDSSDSDSETETKSHRGSGFKSLLWSGAAD